MKKSTRIVKRILALFLVVLMSINTFAAVVSDNDGSAFITKAEFDSLKNDFQSQIDRYNTSIDSKIDGAIASYLSGINISRSVNGKIIFNSWDDYTMVNGSFSNTFGVPQMNLNFNWLHDHKFYNGGYYYLMGTLHSNFATAQSANMNRNVIYVYKKGSDDAGLEADGIDSSIHDFVWRGVAIDWTESIHGTLRKYTTGDMGGASGLKIAFCNGFSFSVSNGYHASGLNIYDVWNPKYYWSSSYNSWSEKTLTNSFGAIDWSCSASNYRFQHIGNFNNDATWEIAVPGWNKTFYTSANTNVTSATIKSAVTQNALGSFLKNKTSTNADSYEAWMPRTVNATFYNSATPTGAELSVKLPSCGMAGNLNAKNILLSKDDIIYEFEGKSYKTRPYIITKGYPLFYASKGTKVTWEPIFSKVSGTGLTGNEEVSIVLAYAPFENGIECGNKYITKLNDTSSTNMIWTTSSKKTKIEFTMPEDGFVVAKWWPASMTASAALNSYWYITLDNKNSNAVTYTLSD